MNYLMAPLETHFDSGFGAMADAFYDAARILEGHKDVEGGVITDSLKRLPLNFLFRHAIELFLKSGIVIVHRKLEIPFGDALYDSDPMVLVGGKWQPMKSIHGIGKLYSYWKSLIESNSDELSRVAVIPRGMESFPVVWGASPQLSNLIRTIDSADSGGTYYRYPMTTRERPDSEKSRFKETSADFFSEEALKGTPVLGVLVENSEGSITRTFVLDRSTEVEQSAALFEAAEILSNFHTMMRYTLTACW